MYNMGNIYWHMLYTWGWYKCAVSLKEKLRLYTYQTVFYLVVNPDMALPYRTGTLVKAESPPMNVQYITITQTITGSAPPGKAPQTQLLAHQREVRQVLPPTKPPQQPTN